MGEVQSLVKVLQGPFFRYPRSKETYSRRDPMAKAECAKCATLFTTVRAFDLHRIGTYAPKTRQCLGEAQMHAKGMTQNGKGWWMAPDYGKVPFWAKPALGGAPEEEAD